MAGRVQSRTASQLVGLPSTCTGGRGTSTSGASCLTLGVVQKVGAGHSFVLGRQGSPGFRYPFATQAPFPSHSSTVQSFESVSQGMQSRAFCWNTHWPVPSQCSMVQMVPSVSHLVLSGSGLTSHRPGSPGEKPHANAVLTRRHRSDLTIKVVQARQASWALCRHGWST